MGRPVLIKIGGSLLPYAGEIIQVILKSNCNALILPGGGIFADAVRKAGVHGTIAHWMAIAGMEQYGWLLSGFGMETTDSPKFSGKPRILLPYRYFRTVDPLPHTWDITSDTISAWFAYELTTDLLILKSIDQIRAGDTQIDQITSLVETSDLDPSFIPFILSHNLTGRIINGSNPDRIFRALQGEPVIGTCFGIMV